MRHFPHPYFSLIFSFTSRRAEKEPCVDLVSFVKWISRVEKQQLSILCANRIKVSIVIGYHKKGTIFHSNCCLENERVISN